MINENTDTPTSESTKLGQPLDPGQMAAPGDDMMEGMAPASSQDQGPVRNPAAPPPGDSMTAGLSRTAPRLAPTPAVQIAPVSAHAGPVWGQPNESPALADIVLPLTGPVTGHDRAGDVLPGMTMRSSSDKAIVASHLNDLVDDVKRLTTGPFNQIKKIMGRQTLAADLMRLYFETHGLSLVDCLSLIVISKAADDNYDTAISFTLPAGKMTGRIQMKLIGLGFKSTKLEEGLVLRSANFPDAA